MIRVASEEAIGKPISPHFLRHTHATVALEKGAPIHLVQNSLGHRSLATTAMYLHVRPNQGSSQYLAAAT
jgi:integrase/recombinase XerD